MLYEYKPELYYKDEAAIEIEGDDDVRFSASLAQFYCPVRLCRCTITRLDLYATYFLGGLEIEKCRILCEVNWQSGGHNERPVRILDSTFSEFVDLEDCSFESEVVLRNVKFLKGTNLLGNIGTPPRAA